MTDKLEHYMEDGKVNVSLLHIQVGNLGDRIQGEDEADMKRC